MILDEFPSSKKKPTSRLQYIFLFKKKKELFWQLLHICEHNNIAQKLYHIMKLVKLLRWRTANSRSADLPIFWLKIGSFLCMILKIFSLYHWNLITFWNSNLVHQLTFTWVAVTALYKHWSQRRGTRSVPTHVSDTGEFRIPSRTFVSVAEAAPAGLQASSSSSTPLHR